jgi:hypothetical protein
MWNYAHRGLQLQYFVTLEKEENVMKYKVDSSATTTMSHFFTQ